MPKLRSVRICPGTCARHTETHEVWVLGVKATRSLVAAAARTSSPDSVRTGASASVAPPTGPGPKVGSTEMVSNLCSVQPSGAVQRGRVPVVSGVRGGPVAVWVVRVTRSA